MRNKYFIFNKESDFMRGYLYNIKTFQTGITIDDADLGRGVFFSRLLDSKEKNTIWHRLLLDYSNLDESSIYITIYASESSWILYRQEEVPIEQLISNPSITLEDKIKAMQPFSVKSVYEPADMLMHDVIGRYVWMRIELSVQSDTLPLIYGIKLYFPKQTWMNYLPEIYQEDKQSCSFIERFLGIYQSLYQDMSQNIQKAPSFFDPDVVTGDYLKWLGTWLSIDDLYIWSEDKLKYLIKNAMRLYKIRGTTKYLSEIIKLYTGKSPYIIEHFQTEQYRSDIKQAELINHLYGDSPYTFTIIIDVGSIAHNSQYKTILKLVNSAKPAHIDSTVIVLKPYIFLNQYSYLGINSVLGQYRSFQLDGLSSLPFSTIDNKTENHMRG